MNKGKIEKKIVIGNWKMNPSNNKEALKLFTSISKLILNIKNTQIVVCPPVLYIENINKNLKKISLGAQDAFWGDVGAFTGQVSVKMLFSAGVKYIILGHSEKRAQGEENSEINKKIKAVLSLGITPVVCFGENNRDESHEYLNFVKVQIEEGLNGISKNLISKIVIAYEPVWAIGKSALREATPEEFREMSIFIKKILNDKFGAKNIVNIKIIYGGSVHPENTLSFLEEGKADGFLVGRDSLDAKKFIEIVNITENEIN